MTEDKNDIDRDIAVKLLRQMAVGSETALQSFYRLFQARVYAFALRRLENPADAADVLNEVMLEAWRSAALFEGRSKVSTWLLGIAHHKIVDNLRRNKRHVHDEIDPEWMDDAGINPIDMIAGIQDAKHMQDCINNLTDSHRLVVHLAFFEDLGYEEIATIAECPVGTVKSRMFHARQLLRQCLTGLNPGIGNNDINTTATILYE